MSTAYRFARNAAKRTPADYAEQRRRQRLQKQQMARGVVPSVEEIFSVDNLLYAFRQQRCKGQSPGVDGLKYEELSIKEAAGIFRVVNRAIVEGTYRPYGTREVQIPKASGTGFRTLKIPTLIDRFVAAALNNALQSLFERFFLDRSYGCRPGRSPWTLLARLQDDVFTRKCYFWAIDDIMDAFPTTSLDAVMADHQQLIADPRLLSAIDGILRGQEKRALGLDQGNPCSPSAMNLRLHNAFDQPMATQTSYWHRYVDNLFLGAQKMEECLAIMEAASVVLNKAGYTLKGTDGPPVDLRRERIQMLGFTVTAGLQELTLTLGTEAWNRLERDLAIEGPKAEDRPMYARKAISGWIDAYGPAFAVARDDVTDRVLKIAAECGYRETFNRDTLRQKMENGWQRWTNLYRSLPMEGSPLRSLENLVVSAAPRASQTGRR